MDLRVGRFLSCSGGSFGFCGGLVVDGGVEGEVAEELAGDGVDDADVKVVDEQDDVGSGVGSADADVVESAVVPQGDVAVGANTVGADSVVGVVAEPSWISLGRSVGRRSETSLPSWRAFQSDPSFGSLVLQQYEPPYFVRTVAPSSLGYH